MRAPVFTVIAALVFAPLLAYSTLEFYNIDPMLGIFDLKEETKKLASELYFQKMTATAQLSVGLLGALWAFVTLGESKVRVTKWPTTCCFALANISFAISLFIYVYGYDFIVSRIFYHGSFDIDAPVVQLVSSHQQYWFLTGSVITILTIAAGRRGKPR